MGQEINVKGLVLHAMSEFIHRSALEFYGYSDSEIENHPDWIHAKNFLDLIGLSVHGFIAPDGSWITGNVDPPEKGLHAGQSKHGDLTNLNDHYLGIEILVEGKNTYDEFIEKIKSPECYSQEQFETATLKTFSFVRDYGFPIENIVTHEQVSGDDVRGEGNGKKDPGAGFPTDQLIIGVQQCVCLYAKLNDGEKDRL